MCSTIKAYFVSYHCWKHYLIIFLRVRHSVRLLKLFDRSTWFYRCLKYWSSWWSYVGVFLVLDSWILCMSLWSLFINGNANFGERNLLLHTSAVSSDIQAVGKYFSDESITITIYLLALQSENSLFLSKYTWFNTEIHDLILIDFYRRALDFRHHPKTVTAC